MKKPDDDDEPKLWVTALKLIVVAAVLIGGTGLLLRYAANRQNASTNPAAAPKGDWGIVNDSPIHRLH